MNNEEAKRIADGLFAIADALHRLGTANAMTEMGAIEFLAKEVRDGAAQIASALEGIQLAIPAELTR